MAGTRRLPEVQIFQDPVASCDHHHDISTAEAALLTALGPVSDASADPAIALNPSYLEPSGLSPLKASQNASTCPPPRALAESNLNSVAIPPPQRDVFRTDSLQKKMLPPRAPGNAPKNQQPQAMFSTFSSAMDKENMPSTHHHYLQAQNTSYNPPMYTAKPAQKRPAVDSAPMGDRPRPNKKAKAQQEEPPAANEPLPDPSQMPPVQDDGKKPNLSYAQLIGMAILRAPNRRLTLAQIYKWISDTFKFYQPNEAGWQNSIRHNLSLNKAFLKQERPKDDPGKGNYWVIKEGQEKQFVQRDKQRRNTLSNGSGMIQTIHSDSLRPSTAPSLGGLSTPSINNIDSSKFPPEEELSSDATIPASDPAIHDGIGLEQTMPPPRNIRSSPPPPEIGSSPPPMPPAVVRESTPPAVPRFPTNSISGGRKRKRAAFQPRDSGYFSSLESSQPRVSTRGMLLPSEIDLTAPSMKRGRAEEDIMRIRSSSFDSPSKARPVLKAPSGHAYSRSALASSSPFRPFDGPSHTPLTPPIKFKKPAKPPQTISPNTNLRNHRKRIAELVGSPDKSLGVLEGSVFSPAPSSTYAPHVHAEDSAFVPFNDDEIRKAFEAYEAGGVGSPSVLHTFSPEKRPAKRPRLERANTASGVLADITNTGSRNLGPLNLPSVSPSLFSPLKLTPSLLRSPMRYENLAGVSPSKPPRSQPSQLQPSPLKPGAVEFATNEGDIFGGSLHSDDDEGEGFDILQGIQKIGARKPQEQRNMGPPRRPARPGLGRSVTTLF